MKAIAKYNILSEGHIVAPAGSVVEVRIGDDSLYYLGAESILRSDIVLHSDMTGTAGFRLRRDYIADLMADLAFAKVVHAQFAGEVNAIRELARREVNDDIATGDFKPLGGTRDERAESTALEIEKRLGDDYAALVAEAAEAEAEISVLQMTLEIQNFLLKQENSDRDHMARVQANNIAAVECGAHEFIIKELK